jgi:prefoldin subunit 5
MFRKTHIKLQHVKAAFWYFVTVLQELTQALHALKAEQTELRSKLDTLVEHSGYLANAKKKDLQRAGHHS